MHSKIKALTLALLLPFAQGMSFCVAGELDKVDVFTAGQEGYQFYRIPAIVTAPDGTLLAFCEGRKSSRSDDGDIDMLLRRSLDGGKTWLPIQVLAEEGGDAPIKFGNPCPVVDTESGTIWLTMNRSTGEAQNERGGGEILVMSSSDHGTTWSKPRDITGQVKKPNWKHYAQGPGIGIQLRHGKHKGRLVVPANYRESFNNRDPSYSHVMFSDDGGQTWQLGGIVGPHTNECQIAEIIEDGKPGLLINARNHWGRAGKPELSGKRLVSRSFDGGQSWSDAEVDVALIEPICQASLLRYSDATSDSNSILLFANPASAGRDHLTARISYDEGRTWPVSRVIDEGSSAYSCLTRLKDGRIGIVYESDNYTRLTFNTFTPAWVRRAEFDRAQPSKTLEPLFHAPAEYADDFGNYRSPLDRSDGKRVTSRAEWQQRRQQILSEWHELLGPWPPLLKKPRIRYLQEERRENFTQHRVQVEVADGGQFTEGHLLIPDGDGPLPAVLVPFYDSATSVGLGPKGQGTHDYGLQLARRGFVTLSIGTPGSIERPEKSTRELLTEIGEQRKQQPLSFLAFVAANCHTALTQLPQVDEKRIGIVGLSYGGKWSMFASCLYDKFACAVWSDPGIVFNENNGNVNYWEPWYLGYEAGVRRPAGIPNADRPRTGLYRRLIEDGRDLNDLHALICPRPVLLAGGTEDPPESFEPSRCDQPDPGPERQSGDDSSSHAHPDGRSTGEDASVSAASSGGLNTRRAGVVAPSQANT